jgi:hypothetical protein
MYASKKTLEDGSYSLDTRATHGNIRNGDTDLNTAWNNRTITMMARSRMVEIEMLEPPTRKVDASEEEINKLFENFRKRLRVRSLDLTNAGWSKFERVRKRQMDAEELSISGVKSLGLHQCMNSVFQKTFTIEDFPIGVVATQAVRSQYACAGCPVCRKTLGYKPETYEPVGIPATSMLRTETKAIHHHLFLFRPDLEDLPEYLLRLIKHAQSFGYSHYIIDSSWGKGEHEVFDAIWKPRQQNVIWDRPDIFVEIRDLKSTFGFIQNYGRPTFVLPSSDDSGTVANLLSEPEDFGRSSLVVASDDLYLPELQRKTKEFDHLRVESSADLEKIRDIS